MEITKNSDVIAAIKPDGMSGKEFAHSLGEPESVISNVANHQRNITLTKLLKWVKITGHRILIVKR